MNALTLFNIYDRWLAVKPLVCQMIARAHTLTLNGSHNKSFVDIFVYLTSFLSANLLYVYRT